MTSQLHITFAEEPIALVPLTTQDGERLAAEQQQRDADLAESDGKQIKLTAP